MSALLVYIYNEHDYSKEQECKRNDQERCLGRFQRERKFLVLLIEEHPKPIVLKKLSVNSKGRHFQELQKGRRIVLSCKMQKIYNLQGIDDLCPCQLAEKGAKGQQKYRYEGHHQK